LFEIHNYFLERGLSAGCHHFTKENGYELRRT
jgi:hypothetical protein